MNPIQEKIISNCFKAHRYGDVDHLYWLPSLPTVKSDDAFSISINNRAFSLFVISCPVYLAENYLNKPKHLNPINDFGVVVGVTVEYSHPFYYFTCKK
jgi:hypothetical protein